MPSNSMRELYFSIKMEIHTIYDNYSIINCTLKYKYYIPIGSKESNTEPCEPK